jgi:uncharacterized protein DUF3455
MQAAQRTAALLSAITCAALAGCLHNGDTKDASSTPGIPPALQVPPNFVLSLKTQASGVQIYQCAATKDDASKYEWTFEAPQADLIDQSGNPIGRHYAGPTWDAADGSSVVGAVKAKDDGPDPKAVPWLLLAAKANGGEGVFSNVQYIQRLYTSGGKAPADGCDQAHAGAEANVPYKASYYFYSPIP